MGRAPCCEKKGLKKGPWTKDEDQLLTNYINQNGHGNWRALPKKAGLLRCGKSCRLRWTNYLRPDIKRGNFTKEEEDSIIELHEELGNKWSAIAAKLPGRTDNEIKNIWHTYLKKRLNPPPEPVKRVRRKSKSKPDIKKTNKTEASGHEDKHTRQAEETTTETTTQHEPLDSSMQIDSHNSKDEPNSPSQSSSENSSITTATTNNNGAATTSTMSDVISESLEKFLQVDDDDFWSDVISGDYSSITSDLPAVNSEPHDFRPFCSSIETTMVDEYDFDPKMPDDMEFWYDIFTRDGEIQKLLQL